MRRWVRRLKGAVACRAAFTAVHVCTHCRNSNPSESKASATLPFSCLLQVGMSGEFNALSMVTNDQWDQMEAMIRKTNKKA